MAGYLLSLERRHVHFFEDLGGLSFSAELLYCLFEGHVKLEGPFEALVVGSYF